MIGLKVEPAKQGFFDSRVVMAATTRAERKNLSRFGAFVRQNALKLLRYGDTVSQPGKPPTARKSARISTRSKRTGKVRSRSASPLREFLYFVYEPRRHNVIIGPAATNQISFDNARNPSTGTVPALLEYGGTQQIFEVQERSGRWHRADLRSPRRIAEKPQRWRSARYEARPFMAPARDQALPSIPRDWLDSIGRAA